MVKVSSLALSFNYVACPGYLSSFSLSQIVDHLVVIKIVDGATDSSSVIAASRATREQLLTCDLQNEGEAIATPKKLFYLFMGEFLFQSGADDGWEADSVERSLGDLKTYFSVVATFSVINSARSKISDEGFLRAKDFSGQVLVKCFLEKECPGSMDACIGNRLLNFVQLFAGDFAGVGDWSLWLHFGWLGPRRLRTKCRGHDGLHGRNQSQRNLVQLYRNQLLILARHESGLIRFYPPDTVAHARVWGRKDSLLRGVKKNQKIAKYTRKQRHVGSWLDCRVHGRGRALRPQRRPRLGKADTERFATKKASVQPNCGELRGLTDYISFIA